MSNLCVYKQSFSFCSSFLWSLLKQTSFNKRTYCTLRDVTHKRIRCGQPIAQRSFRCDRYVCGRYAACFCDSWIFLHFPFWPGIMSNCCIWGLFASHRATFHTNLSARFVEEWWCVSVWRCILWLCVRTIEDYSFITRELQLLRWC